MSFAVPDVDWADLGKSVTRAPQLIKQKVFEEFHIGDSVDDKEIFQDPDNLTKAQIEHVKGIIKKYESLQDIIRRHGLNFNEFIEHFWKIVIGFNVILEEENGFDSIINDLKNNLKEKIDEFNKRMDHILNQLLKITKNLQKIIKERGYLEIDIRKFFSENKKLKLKPQMSDKEYKKVFENDRKIQEIRDKFNQFESLLKAELPSFMIYISSIAKEISKIIVCYMHDLYHTLYSSLVVIQNRFPNIKMDNIYFENDSKKILDVQGQIRVQIESMGFFKSAASIYNTVALMDACTNGSNSITKWEHQPATKQGTAMYDFAGESASDLAFHKGDVVTVLQEDDSGWWKGRLGGRIGYFPSNYFSFQ